MHKTTQFYKALHQSCPKRPKRSELLINNKLKKSTVVNNILVLLQFCMILLLSQNLT